MEPKFWVLDSTFRFTLEKCSKLKKPVYSPPNFWQIYVGPDDKKTFLNCYVKCKMFQVNTYQFLTDQSADTDSWTCDAIVELRILNKFTGHPSLFLVTKGIVHKNTWFNFDRIIEWNKLLAPDNGFINNDEVVFEIHVSSNYKSLTVTDDYTKGLLRRCQVDVDNLEMKLKNKQLLLENKEEINNRREKKLEDLNETIMILNKSLEFSKSSSATKDKLIAFLNEELSRLKSQNNELFELVGKKDSRNEVMISNGNIRTKWECLSRLNKQLEQLAEDKIVILNEKTILQHEKKEIEEELILEKKIKQDSLEELKICQKQYKLALENVFQLDSDLKCYKQHMTSARIELEKILSLADENEIGRNNIELLMKLLDINEPLSKDSRNPKNFSNEIVNLQQHLEFILEVEESEKISKENTIKKLNKKLKDLLSDLEKHRIISAKYEEKFEAATSIISGLVNHMEESGYDISTVRKDHSKVGRKCLLTDLAISSDAEADTMKVFNTTNPLNTNDNITNIIPENILSTDMAVNEISID